MHKMKTQILPKISIITPSFNQGHFIEETIDSILSQGYENLEYIIMDGGSTDNTVEVIKKYEKHITHWESVKDDGQSHAINKGFKMATGDVINWINSDDYYEPSTLKTVSDAFQHPETNVFCGRSRVFGVPKPYISNGTDIYNSLEKTIAWARIDQPETFFRKSVIDSIGLLEPQLHYCMDKELWLRYLFLFGMKGIVASDKLLVHFRIHGDSKTNNFQERFRQETDLIYNSLFLNKINETDLAYFKDLKTLNLSKIYEENSELNWAKMYSYYFLQKFLVAYAQDDRSECKNVIPYIQKDLLEANDLVEFEKVITRSKYLPVFLKQLLNKVKS